VQLEGSVLCFISLSSSDVSDGCLKRTCSLDTSAFSALEVLTTTALYKFTYLLTCIMPCSFCFCHANSMSVMSKNVTAYHYHHRHNEISSVPLPITLRP